jgi:serine phosphatase RsbU (regulator of sigma subunit)
MFSALPRGLLRPVRIASVVGGVLVVFAVWLAVGSHSAGVAFFYSIPVGLTAWWFGLRPALLAALVCVGLYGAGDAIHPVPEFALALLLRAVFLLAVAAIVSWLAERLSALEHSAEELEAIRAALAPAELPDLIGVDAAAAFVPSELGVSGDFYLLTNGPDGSTVAIVGDVVGHGPAAAQLATFIRARFAAFAANTSNPAELLTLANAALVDRPGRAEELVSAVCVRLHQDQETFSWARAGHPPPLRLPGLEELSLDGSTFLLGADRRIELQNKEASMAGSEGLIVYTDGATDVRRGRALLGLEGLRGVLAPLAELTARAMVEEVERSVVAWADRPIRDDLCVLVLKPRPG